MTETGQTEQNGVPQEDAPFPEGLDRVIEALLFSADSAITPNQIGNAFAEVTGHDVPGVGEVSAAIEALNQRYEDGGHAFRVRKWAGGYRLATLSEYAPFVKTLLVDADRQGLSRSLLETLAIMAYRQPVTRPEIDFIRGVSSDYAVRKLLNLGLVDVIGRSDSLGRPLLYGTTDRFLDQFGLEDLDDLPNMREVEELLDDPNFDEERAQLLTLKQKELIQADDLPEQVEAAESDGESAEYEHNESEETSNKKEEE